MAAVNTTLETTPEGHERLRKSRRTRVILIIVIVILVAGLGATAYFGYTIISGSISKNNTTTIKTNTQITDSPIVDQGAPGEVKIETTSIPSLAPFFGKNAEEISGQLGNGFQLKSTTLAEDATNPNISQLATFSYTATVMGDTSNNTMTGALPTQSVYASLNSENRVIDIYYTADLRLLGYPEKSFDDLLATDEVILGALSAAGVTPRDFSYTPPSPDESIVYDNVNSENRRVVKQSQIFSGRTTSENAPTVWTLTITYDFGSGVNSTNEFREATRTINLKLA